MGTIAYTFTEQGSAGLSSDEIGLLGRKYVEEAATHLESFRGTVNPNLDTIPQQIWAHLQSAAVGAGYSSVGTLLQADMNQRQLTVKRLGAPISKHLAVTLVAPCDANA